MGRGFQDALEACVFKSPDFPLTMSFRWRLSLRDCHGQMAKGIVRLFFTAFVSLYYPVFRSLMTPPAGHMKWK